MARTLIYALGSVGHGTKRLAKAFADIGIDSGHDVMGQGAYGSVKDVPNFLEKGLYHHDTYPRGTPQGGLVGDDIVANLFFAYAPYRFRAKKDVPSFLQGEIVATLRKALGRYLEGEGYLVDINTHLADFWPFISDAVAKKTRCIHLTKDPREWVQKLMYFHSFSETSTNYGSVHNIDTIYPPLIPAYKKLLEDQGRFTVCCQYWTDLHSWFDNAWTLRIRVEDFNKPETSARVLSALLPKATVEQKAAFTLADEKYVDGYSVRRHERFTTGETGFPPWEEWDKKTKATFNKICGPLSERFGYGYA